MQRMRCRSRKIQWQDQCAEEFFSWLRVLHWPSQRNDFLMSHREIRCFLGSGRVFCVAHVLPLSHGKAGGLRRGSPWSDFLRNLPREHRFVLECPGRMLRLKDPGERVCRGWKRKSNERLYRAPWEILSLPLPHSRMAVDTLIFPCTRCCWSEYLGEYPGKAPGEALGAARAVLHYPPFSYLLNDDEKVPLWDPQRNAISWVLSL